MRSPTTPLASPNHRVTEWGAEKPYTDYRAMLDDPSVDAVEILTPHSLHARMVIDALDADKHVSLQKPMAINLKDCNVIVAAAEKSGRFMRVFENFAYYEPLVRAKQMLDDGVIGEPISMRIKTVTGHRQYGWDIPDESIAWRYDQSINGVGKAILDYGTTYSRWLDGSWVNPSKSSLGSALPTQQKALKTIRRYSFRGRTKVVKRTARGNNNQVPR